MQKEKGNKQQEATTVSDQRRKVVGSKVANRLSAMDYSPLSDARKLAISSVKLPSSSKTRIVATVGGKIDMVDDRLCFYLSSVGFDFCAS